jgi:hypothetical protein
MFDFALQKVSRFASGQPLLRTCASKRLWLSLRDLSAKTWAELGG